MASIFASSLFSLVSSCFALRGKSSETRSSSIEADDVGLQVVEDLNLVWLASYRAMWVQGDQVVNEGVEFWICDRRN